MSDAPEGDPRVRRPQQIGWVIFLIGSGLIVAFTHGAQAGDLWWLLLGLILIAYSGFCLARRIPFAPVTAAAGAFMSLLAGADLIGFHFSMTAAVLIAAGVAAAAHLLWERR